MQTTNRRIGQTRAAVEGLLAANKDRARQISQLKKLVAQLESQLLGTGRILIADPGALPSAPFADERLLYATRWAGMGALPGLLALLLLAFRRRGSGVFHPQL